MVDEKTRLTVLRRSLTHTDRNAKLPVESDQWVIHGYVVHYDSLGVLF